MDIALDRLGTRYLIDSVFLYEEQVVGFKILVKYPDPGSIISYKILDKTEQTYNGTVEMTL